VTPTTPRSEERARTGDLAEAIARLLPALEQFLAFAPGPDPARLRSRWRPALAGRLPEEGIGAEAVLDEIAALVIPHGLRIGAPGFSGWVTTMPTTVPVAAALAGAVAAPQRWWVHPANFLEVLAMGWLVELLGFPPGFHGTFASGGAAANLLGLGAARQHAGERLGIDVREVGVAGIPEPRIYAPPSVHRVVARALAILGLGDRSLCPIPERSGRGRPRGPDLNRLEALLDEDLAAGRTPVAVVASAGDVNLGAVDPLEAMADIARARGIWFHVDGAYGGFGILDERVRPLYGELGKIDSFAVDPHKWMATPVGCGALLVRDPELLERAFAIAGADYVRFQRRRGADPGSPFDELGEGSPDRSIEHSSPARGLAVWALLKEIGASGMRARIGRHLDCARRVAERVRATSELELLSEPVLSICCFRVHPPAIRDSGTLERLNREVLERLHARGRAVPSSTRVDNKLAIRPCFIGARTGVDDADALVDEVLAIVGEL
jgi:glutamate/tyrosine decarboxylase-like PLP-dependent enzyme